MITGGGSPARFPPPEVKEKERGKRNGNYQIKW